MGHDPDQRKHLDTLTDYRWGNVHGVFRFSDADVRHWARACTITPRY